MPDFGTWAGTPHTWLGSDTLQRAYDTAQRIAEKPTTIVVRRQGVDLAPQVVRIDLLGLGNSVTASATAQASEVGYQVMGYRDHPTLADTDLERGDRFPCAGRLFVVEDVLVDPPGRLLAIVTGGV